MPFDVVEPVCHSIEQVVSLVEKELILQVLRTCQGVQTKAATMLGINRNTLHKKIEDYHLEAEAR